MIKTKTRFPQCVLVSATIPWDDREELMEDSLRTQIREMTKHFSHVYIFGTAGEGYGVDTRRFQQIVDVFCEETKGENLFPQVGTIGLSTANIIERFAYAHDKGIREFQVSCTAWHPLDDDEILTFFKDVCGAFPDSSFLHYNNPASKLRLSGLKYRRIADEVGNLTAHIPHSFGTERTYFRALSTPIIDW